MIVLRDKSVEVAQKKGVAVYRLEQHMGKGYALRTGFSKAKGKS